MEFGPSNGIVGTHRDPIRVAVARGRRQAVPLSGTWTGFPSVRMAGEVDIGETPGTGGAVRARAAG